MILISPKTECKISKLIAPGTVYLAMRVTAKVHNLSVAIQYNNHIHHTIPFVPIVIWTARSGSSLPP